MSANIALERALAANVNGKRDRNLTPEALTEPLANPLKFVSMIDVEAKSVSWLWPPYLPLGAFCLMEGPEGLGKTYISCALATAVASGHGLPFVPEEQHIHAGNVLMASAEDSLSHVLKPRLQQMQAPMERIFATDDQFTLDKTGILRLSAALDRLQPRLLIIDPLFSYTGRINLNNDNEIRSVTDELKRLAETYDCTILGIRHIGKSKGMGDVRNAGLNGVGWRAAARSCLLVGADPNDQRIRAIVHTKSNLGPICDRTIGYQILDGQFGWKANVQLTAEQMLSASRTETAEERGERVDAMHFLRETLRGGFREPVKRIQAAARQAGISEATLRRAKTALGVVSSKGNSANGEWFWELPANSSSG